MNIRRSRVHHSGLTLLELLVVLTILVVLSTVAITSTSGVADQAHYEATQRTLQNISDAVLGPVNQRDADGSLLITGFVADMGRLPQATAETTSDGGTVFTLKELWTNVNSLPAHTVLQAVAPNVNDSTLADPDVYVLTGWRGPYLNLPPGNTVLRDGWGAELASPSGAVASVPYALLLDPDGSPITAAGQSIGQVNSFGANGVQDAADIGYDLDVAANFSTAQTTANVSVTVNVLNADGSTAAPLPSDQISVCLFAPDPS